MEPAQAKINTTQLHEWKYCKDIDNLEDFKKLIDWLSGEFSLYLQDDLDGLTVFFPNGWFSIKKSFTSTNLKQFCIEIKSKSIRDGNHVYDCIEGVLNQIKKLKCY